MIQIPSGFDYLGLLADYMEALSPFLFIQFMFTIYRHFKRAGNYL